MKSNRFKGIFGSHFKNFEKINARTPGLYSPTLEVQQKFQRLMQPYVLQGAELGRVTRTSMALPEYKFPGLDRITRQALNLRKSIDEIFRPVQSLLERTFEDLPDRTQEALSAFGENGWYIDLEMSISDLREITELFSNGDTKEAEKLLIEYFECRFYEIEESILNKFSDRARVLGSAFRAHKEGDYDLSIPVFLAQTDGICKELVNAYLFTKLRRTEQPEASKYVEKIPAGSYRAALLSPLTKNYPITQSKGQRGESFSGLNRHMVMHGESLDYGTKVNGMKALSLINYVAHVLSASSDDPQ